MLHGFYLLAHRQAIALAFTSTIAPLPINEPHPLGGIGGMNIGKKLLATHPKLTPTFMDYKNFPPIS
jgi:hypothetical protein